MNDINYVRDRLCITTCKLEPQNGSQEIGKTTQESPNSRGC